MSDEAADSNWNRLVGRSLTIWLVLIAAEIGHGVVRAVALVPAVGEFRASQIGVFSGSAIILLIAWLFIRWIGATRQSELFIVGLVWLVLTVAFELLFGRLVFGIPWQRIAADYNLWQGGLMPIGLLILFFSPMIAARMKTPEIRTDVHEDGNPT